MNPTTRSLLRSLFFAVLPVLVVYFGDAALLGNLIPSLSPEVASLIALLIGTVARALFPDAFGKRPPA